MSAEALIADLYAEIDRQNVALVEIASLALRWAPSDEDAKLVHVLLELPQLHQEMTGPVLTFRDVARNLTRLTISVDETGRTRVEAPNLT